jgi:hypothetical protein
MPLFAATDSFQYVILSQPQTGERLLVSVVGIATHLPFPQFAALQYLPAPHGFEFGDQTQSSEPLSAPPSVVAPLSAHV